ncbi:DUF488 domain-containing protein [Caulobacter sp. SSI4214]|uniref:DUF488 domain-containing protein n=1 Tax=Caulobacter sp. SSI4214 TaxID=2575739 RepID=UPI001439DA38|nr:DUF488 domain-containing protein [Caulobacter sp. SSI4214]
MNKLSTIGYETDTQAGLIARLKAAEVDLVVDVRAVAASRRAGFSKTLLANSLAAEGIGYLHLRPLGTPKPGRDAARAGRVDEMRAIFEAHLEEPAAQLALAQATELAKDKRVALLCYEDDAACCHRRIVADRIRQTLKCEVADL